MAIEKVHMGRSKCSPKLKKVIDDVELAIKANGGKNWKVNWCQCDPDVGMVPCEYCAIYHGLKNALRYLKEGEKAEIKNIPPASPYKE